MPIYIRNPQTDNLGWTEYFYFINFSRLYAFASKLIRIITVPKFPGISYALSCSPLLPLLFLRFIQRKEKIVLIVILWPYIMCKNPLLLYA